MLGCLFLHLSAVPRTGRRFLAKPDDRGQDLSAEFADVIPDVVQEALNLGALGYVVKAHVGIDLLAAVEAVILGEQFVSRLPNCEVSSRPNPNPSSECDIFGG